MSKHDKLKDNIIPIQRIEAWFGKQKEGLLCLSKALCTWLNAVIIVVVSCSHGNSYGLDTGKPFILSIQRISLT